MVVSSELTMVVSSELIMVVSSELTMVVSSELNQRTDLSESTLSAGVLTCQTAHYPASCPPRPPGLRGGCPGLSRRALSPASKTVREVTVYVCGDYFTCI